MEILKAVQSIKTYNLWIGAGFIRNLVWNNLHGQSAHHDGDIDILWFDKRGHKTQDIEIENNLIDIIPDVDWSVKNQALMHVRNHDHPYESIDDAMQFWPETATAVAVRLYRGEIEIIAPFGLDDLFNLQLKATPSFTGSKRLIFDHRIAEKGWNERWPKLHYVEA